MVDHVCRLTWQHPIFPANRQVPGRECWGLDPSAIPKTKKPLLAQCPRPRPALPTRWPTDPTIYRFYEALQVYGGRRLKELIPSSLATAIMTAINFTSDLAKKSRTRPAIA